MKPAPKLVSTEWEVDKEHYELRCVETFKIAAHYNELLVFVPTTYYTTGSAEPKAPTISIFTRLINCISRLIRR